MVKGSLHDKYLKCRLLQFLFIILRVNIMFDFSHTMKKLRNSVFSSDGHVKSTGKLVYVEQGWRNRPFCRFWTDF